MKNAPTWVTSHKLILYVINPPLLVMVLHSALSAFPEMHYLSPLIITYVQMKPKSSFCIVCEYFRNHMFTSEYLKTKE